MKPTAVEVRPASYCPACDSDIEIHQAHCSGCNDHVSASAPLCGTCDAPRDGFIYAIPGRRPTVAVARGQRHPDDDEQRLEEFICRALNAAGQSTQRQVWVPFGRADIVTPTAVIEVKCRLTAPAILQATGQVLLYRQAIDPKRDAVIAGQRTLLMDLKAGTAVRAARKLGIRVEYWRYEYAADLDTEEAGGDRPGNCVVGGSEEKSA